MILESRARYASSEAFRDEFLDTLTPGIIPRKNFIHWETISQKVEGYKKYFEFFRNLPKDSDEELRVALRDALLADDTPYFLIKTAFQLFGHTGGVFTSNEDFVDFKKFGELEKTEEHMEYIANLLTALGLRTILGYDLEDYFEGVQIGLETHRRKNVGGAAFVDIIRAELSEIVKNLQFKGQDWALTEEHKILYSDGVTSKRVDFLLIRDNLKIGVEVNFYTASGSKPTEIKRSYGQVNSSLAEVNASLIWITDGAGYMKMQRSLKEARDIHQNIYNLSMVRTSLEADLLKAVA